MIISTGVWQYECNKLKEDHVFLITGPCLHVFLEIRDKTQELLCAGEEQFLVIPVFANNLQECGNQVVAIAMK